MSRENLIGLGLLGIGMIIVIISGFKGGYGQGYYEDKPDGKTANVAMTQAQTRIESGDKTVHWSFPRTFGIWVSAFCSLAILSFLYKDNPLYKFAEHAFVGISAAYYMVIAVWTTLIPNLLGKLLPRLVKSTMQPGLDLDTIIEKHTDDTIFGVFRWAIPYENVHYDGLAASWIQLLNPYYILPVVMGVMLLWRLAPKGQWIARWALAFILGYTSGLRLVGYLGSDFVRQIAPTITPIAILGSDNGAIAYDFGWAFYHSMNAIIVLLGVGCGLTYFFFSFEHTGLVGRVSRVGIWILMITFGAGFGYTVMGRIALLVGRFQYLVIDWLNVVPSPS